MPRNDRLYRALLEELRRQVTSGYQPGEPIPSQRALAEMHGVGLATVHRALRTLGEEGLVESRRGSGVIRCEGKKPKSRKRKSRGLRIGVLTRRTETEWIRKRDNLPHYTAINDEAERRGMKLVWVTNLKEHHPTPARNRVEIARVPWNEFDVGLLIEVEDSDTLTHPAVHKHKLIAVDQDATPLGIHSVSFDDRGLGAFVARQLWDLGHRRFAVTDEVSGVNWPWENAWLVRRHAFIETIGRLGGMMRGEYRVCVPNHGRGTGLSPEMVASRTADCWANLERGLRPTALFATNPGIVPRLLRELKRYDIRVPRDLSIVSVTWHQEDRTDQRRKTSRPSPTETGESLLMTRIQLDLPALARRVLDTAEDLAADRPIRGGVPAGSVVGNDAFLVTAPYVLKEGETVSAVGGRGG